METALTGSLSLVPSYVYWHYGRAAGHIWSLARDFSWFLWNFFSISLLARTFFHGWWRETNATHFSADMLVSGEAWGTFFANLFANSIILLFGIIVRSVVITLGLLAQAIFWPALVIFFLFWLIVPVVIAFLVVAAIVFTVRPL